MSLNSSPNHTRYLDQGTYFQHVDGGWYKYLMSGHYAEDNGEVVIMEHVWPFDPAITVRTMDNFKTRFTKKTKDEHAAAVNPNNHRLDARKVVAMQKAERKRSEDETVQNADKPVGKV